MNPAVGAGFSRPVLGAASRAPTVKMFNLRSIMFKALLLTAMAIILALQVPAAHAKAMEGNYLYRLEVREYDDYTRIVCKVDHTPEHTVSVLPGKRVRLVLRDTTGPLFSKLRDYSDRNIGGIKVSRFGSHLQLTFDVKDEQPGLRTPVRDDSRVFILDVGPRFKGSGMARFLPGRERIWTGVDHLIRDFDPPLKADVPFNPTDRRTLMKLVPEEQVRQFLAGEEALYKGRLSQAEEIFTEFARLDTQVRPLALMRLGEAEYGQHKYRDALKSFQTGEKLWPEFVQRFPSSAFYYADSLVRSGDLQAGRRLMTRLIAEIADKNYAPVVLVRLADILSRQNREAEALAIYRTVSTNFTGNKANLQARMKLADRRLLAVNIIDYQALAAEYMEIYNGGGDFDMREEALFKTALLESLFGEAGQALSLVVQYERKYPKGVYSQVTRAMREELLLPVYFDLYNKDDGAGILKLAHDNRDYLSRCFTDEDFAESLHDAFLEQGRTKEEIEFFAVLLEKPWTSSHAPYLIRQIMINAEALADYPLVERASEAFISRFPTHPAVPEIREGLGRLSFMRREMPAVVKRLAWLLPGKSRAENPESYYYLGKALESTGNLQDAERAMGMFIMALHQRKMESPLAPDAYYVAASSRLAAGDRKEAIGLLRAGSESAGGSRRDQFNYKLGELASQAGDTAEARSRWELVAGKGADEFWRKMASQALSDLGARQHLKTRSGVSK